jgi:subtilisin family serine protease
VNPTKLSDNDKMEYARYLSFKKEVETQREKAAKNYDEIAPVATTVEKAFDAFQKEANFTYFNAFTLDTFYSGNQLATIGKSILGQVLTDSQEDSLNLKEVTSEIMAQLNEEKDYYGTKLFYQYNPDFDSRTSIVKDDYNNGKERIYGNNDVEGPNARHGTHVAGIIGAIRNNSIGMDGVAEYVQIMAIRVVPDGDERDKDVANGIRYAVDNGASIINMSFGKGHSWDKDLVDEAIKYAAKNDVLVIHAAGNDNKENTLTNNYPHDHYDKKGCFLFPKKEAKNWIEVGAISYMGETDLVAGFSNYSADIVDVFAPGELIFSTVPDDKYEFLNGTSMAAPVVAGLAAVIRSYYPALSAEQVKKIIEESVIKIDQEVKKPGSDELVYFSKLSKTGGVVNLYQAFELASKTKGKKKVKEEKHLDRV